MIYQNKLDYGMCIDMWLLFESYAGNLIAHLFCLLNEIQKHLWVTVWVLISRSNHRKYRWLMLLRIEYRVFLFSFHYRPLEVKCVSAEI